MRKMTFAKLFALVLVALVAVPSVFAQDGTVVDIVVESEDHNTLEAAVGAAGLVDVLADPEAEFTVFAPTDDAFGNVPTFVVDAALADAEGILTTLLTYHVVPGTILSGDIAEGCSQVATVQGGELTVCNDMGVVTVNSANVIAADLEAGNGVVHVVDAVVIPPIELPEVDPLAVEGEIISAGSSTVAPLSTEIASRFNDDGAPLPPTVDSIGSGGGFERFCTNLESDISNASRPIRDSEIETCRENGRDPIEFRVGTDALAVTVSVDNDFLTEGLSLEEMAQIFNGEAVTWADVNPEWPDENIQIFSPGTDSGTFDYFVEEVLDENPEGLLANPNAQFSENDDVLVEGISGSPFAIGYFGYAYYVENTDILQILDVDGVTPNASNVDNGSYPLARPLFIYSTADIMAEKPQVAAFIAYYLTVVNEEITEVGYFPAAPDALNLSRLQWVIATSN